MTRVLAITLTLALALGGCSIFQKDDDRPPLAPEPPPQATYLRETGVQPDTPRDSGTAVESALAWSEKYARAVEQLARQQEENHDLLAEKQQLDQKMVALQAELAQTRKELGEANDLLIEVRRANDQWKVNILGYRNEMRQAQQAELEALRKVLRLLGGEVAETADDTASATPDPAATPPAADGQVPATTATTTAPQGETRASSE